tara:strand:- start:421 stop:603 length:183 start_codon:yes stop_codon:yes gene_type:complete
LGGEVDGAEMGGLFWTSELRRLRQWIDLEKEADAARKVVFLPLSEIMFLEWLFFCGGRFK